MLAGGHQAELFDFGGVGRDAVGLFSFVLDFSGFEMCEAIICKAAPLSSLSKQQSKDFRINY